MANTEEAAWTVIAQAEDFGADDTGQFTSGVRITFRVASGSTGSVFIPAKDYTVAKARAVIAEKASSMEAIGNLTG